MRLARTHTKHNDFIVVEHAYHGHTTAVLDISPYKYEHEGGEGQKPWVHKVICPDTYRGVHRTTGDPAGDRALGTRYADRVKDACSDAGGGVAGFFIESSMSVVGVILPPEGTWPQRTSTCVRPVASASETGSKWGSAASGRASGASNSKTLSWTS